MYIGVDLGSTNVKAALYDEKLNCIGQKSVPVTYIRQGAFIEFDEKKIHIALYMLLNDFGDIKRHDNWSGKTKFQVLDERHRNTT